jgi:hypothetical protein
MVVFRVMTLVLISMGMVDANSNLAMWLRMSEDGVAVKEARDDLQDDHHRGSIADFSMRILGCWSEWRDTVDGTLVAASVPRAYPATVKAERHRSQEQYI